MRILAAEITNFRNIVSADVQFAPRLTAFVGANGQGKTNFLEALYTVAALRPLRNASRRDLVRAGASRASVKVTLVAERTGLTHEVRLELERGQRALWKDGKASDASELLGTWVAVAFTPDDLDISKGAPELRRRFLDRALLNARPAYLDRALRYARALRSRNRLLTSPQVDPTLLDAYDETLASVGADVAVARARYVDELAPRVERCFREIAAPAPPLAVRYAGALAEHVTDVAAARAALREALAARRESDKRRGTTSVGPHLDDLELRMEGAPARGRASQGQHRALVLALKLAEITLLTETLGEPPVLLLDDISSELDDARTRQLFSALAPLAGQVVLTTTDRGQIARVGEIPLRDRCVYRVHAGTFERDPEPDGLTSKNGGE